GLAWGGTAQAQACDFVAIGPTTQTGLAGSNVSFTIEAQTACAPTVDVSLVVTPPDNTGGATIVAPANPTLDLDDPYTFSVTLGPNPGAGGSVTATCLNGGCAGDVLVFNFNTNNDFDYDHATVPSVVTNQIRDFTVATSLQLNGAPAGLPSNFVNVTNATPYGQVPANASGVASLTETIPVAGNYVVRAGLVCPTAFVLEGCAAVPPVDFNILVEPVALDPVTPLAVTAFPAIAQTLTVSYGSASFPGPNATPITWVIASQPGGGDGALTGSNLLGGESDAVFSATVPGVYTVQASVACAVCAVNTRTFTINVSAAPPPYALTVASPNPAPGTVGVPQAFSVQLDVAGVPVAAGSVQWSAGAPFSPASAASVTDGGGIATASFTPSASGTFPAVVSASFDPDGIPASGDEVVVSFDATVAATPGLAIASGNDQQATPGSAFGQPLVVLADNGGVPTPGIGIIWTVAGDATLVAGGATDASGQASATLTAGASLGAVAVTATRADAPGVSVTFNLAVANPGALELVSGQGQSLLAGQASEPLVVRLLDVGGNPVVGATVNWTTSVGGLETTTSSTDASGEASTRLTLAAAGEAEVTATSPLATAPVVFRLRGALAGLAGLDEDQAEVAAAVDAACPALAALTTRSPGQQDLYERCQELGRAAALDPAATVFALDQLMADL
ncbi:MAG TPA: Ig-like domain-containing protein, partial [Arenimonas sp.]|nr:Ig-like domain-containing protein [Arenimonas sp.]